MHTTNIEPHVSFSVGQSKNMAPGIIPLVMEDKIYSRTEMRELEIDTSDYRFLTEVGDFCAQLVLKAEAREGMLRASSALRTEGRSSRPSSGGRKRRGYGISLWENGCSSTMAATQREGST